QNANQWNERLKPLFLLYQLEFLNLVPVKKIQLAQSCGENVAYRKVHPYHVLTIPFYLSILARKYLVVFCLKLVYQSRNGGKGLLGRHNKYARLRKHGYLTIP